ncbi:jg7346 [Pararge aegeria aegeria]|uniref:5'-nucleotidase n=2 Tax=Pararge aegeria aegeria TaxID=348720 RepID=A0A8S4RHY0_9NEOP|nr:jg7346 [Pararge aegeria aegeria]
MKVVHQIQLISLGNHEFDNGVSGLTPFIRNLSCPTLAANLILTSEPTMEAEKNLMKSVVFNINGTKIGIIGYLTPETKTLAIGNNVDYIDEIVAIIEELNKLKNEGVQIFVALGHSGFQKDLEIAEKVEGIDLVIGGHTNTFLWNGNTIDTEIPQGPYPTLVKQNSGRQVPVVQAYAYTKYLGKLHLLFNSRGEIVRFDGNPILLDNSIPQDPTVLSIVNRYRENIAKISEVVVGTASSVLDGLSCRLQECNLGNLIADAMVDKYAFEYIGDGWTDAPVAVIQGGGIRASISHVDQRFNITKGELYTVMPFAGYLVKITINGTKILKMLEHSVADYNIIRAPGQFLQVSGLKVEYDFKKPPGARVVKVLVRCGKCKIPTYEPLNKTVEYNILTSGFLANGGDGFSVFKELPFIPLKYNEFQCTLDYMNTTNLVHPSVEGRIIIHNAKAINSLGNHEFDNGVSGLSPFIENLTCPVLAVNLILTKVPELENEANLRKSVVFNISGTPIGVIGYLTPETKMLAVKNNVEYIDEIIALREEVQKLKSEGVHIIVGLGHSGFLKDLEIARAVEGLSLVIGGHSNTFLWNGTSPDSEISQGPYPTYVTQASGKQVPVVQAYAYTKYLGKLHIVFNKKGELLSADGIPILLDKTIPQDPEVLDIVKRYREQILNYTEEVIGTTSVVLDGLSCQHKECNMGNLITDAIVYQYVSEFKGKNQWTDAPIAIIQGGGIRSSITLSGMPTTVTKGDLVGVLPFKGFLVIVTMSGKILIQMLEHAIENLSDLDYPGEFLQVSGLKVTYDNRKKAGSKVSLGNHEFDEEVKGLIPFIRNLTSPIVTANLKVNNVPELMNIPNLYNSIVIIKNGVKIGIIGYLTPETKFLAAKNNVEYEDEILALNREVKKLKDNGIQILIALGHSGYLKDLEIAEKVDDLDLVIGGHSNTFLVNKNSTEEIPEYPQGPYPTLVQQKSGRNVLVVQAYAYTKYLGKLHLIFNGRGEIVKYDGYPILLNKDIPQDPDVLEIVKRYQKDVDRINNEVVGTSLVFLDGDSCRLRECNMGNFINDAIINYTNKYFNNIPLYYIAITQGGRIRTSINHPEKPFNITRGDLITIVPYSDTLCVLTMNGIIFRQALEHSVQAWRPVDTPGQFLQYSGVEVVYDLAQNAGSRIVRATAVCSKCSEPSDLQDDYEYQVITSIFIANGGDGYTMFEKLARDVLPFNEAECILNYLFEYSPIHPVLSDRIIILNENKVATIPSARINSDPSNSVTIEFNTKMYLLVGIYCILFV